MNNKKYLIVIFILIGISSLFFQGCKKENSNPENEKNVFSYKGEEYELNNCYFLIEEDNNTYEIHIALTSSSIYWSQDIQDFKGTGNIVAFFGLNSDGSYNVPSGKYYIGDDSFGDSFAIINGDVEAYENAIECESNGGSLEILNNGNDEYEIKFELFTDDNEKVSGYFSGNVTQRYFDY